jgi:tRNA threonylcarbamoyladenosine biosynthesis protein TsaB
MGYVRYLKKIKEHASFVHLATKEILKEGGFQLKDVDAFSVTSGPGSYTGLRVGMATVKGFCYALSKPLIAINTLEVMAKSAIDKIGGQNKELLFCPMIDARRMEVFAAIYDGRLKKLMSPRPLILEEGSFANYLTDFKIIFFGNGSEKWKALRDDRNTVFEQIESNAKHLAGLADTAFSQKDFADVTYSQPNYFKEFHSH